MPTLLALFGPRRGVARAFTGRLVLGRGRTADVPLIDDRVSREHCAIEPTERGYRVVDLGSRNGTWLNGVRVEAAPLGPDDRLAVGESVFTFEPSAQALRAQDGSTTLVVTRGEAASEAPDPGGALDPALLWAIAGRAQRAGTPEAALAVVLAEAAARAGAVSAVAIRRAGEEGELRPLAGHPAGALLALPESLVRRMRAQERVLTAPAEQVEARTDAETTQVSTRAGVVVVAPARWLGRAVGWVAAHVSSKPSPEVLAWVTAAAELAAPYLRPVEEAPAPLPAEQGGPLIAESPPMKALVAQALRLAQTQTTVLLTGPSGAGKERIAQLLHREGRRARGPLVAVNCGAIPAELAESILFGHDKGAFTGAQAERRGLFERADGGTLFLDEVAELTPALQVKLLRVLDERVVERLGSEDLRPVDVRVVAATHKDLVALVAQGRFREDLAYRLRVVQLALPPLAERPEDVAPLARHLVERAARALAVEAKAISPAALRALCAHRWPGNVRELANALERALVLGGPGAQIEVEDLPAEVRANVPRPRGAQESDEAPEQTHDLQLDQPLDQQIARLERRAIHAAMRSARGKKARAAELLGISRPTLDKKLAEYAIDVFGAEPPP